MIDPSAVELAYFAGFFDGEGCIYLNRSDRKEAFHTVEAAHTIHCSVSNTYKPTVNEFLPFFGGTVVLQRRKITQPQWKDRWLWRVSGLTAGRFLTLIEPFLKEKRLRAISALFFCDSIAWPKQQKFLSPDATYLRRIAIRGFIANRPTLRGRWHAKIG